MHATWIFYLELMELLKKNLDIVYIEYHKNMEKSKFIKYTDCTFFSRILKILILINTGYRRVNSK